MRLIRLATAAAVAALLPISLLASEKEGAEVFKKSCAVCHGADATGNTPVGKSMKIKDLHSAEVQGLSKADMVKVVTDGKGKMTGFKSKLTAAQIDDVVSYIRTFKK
ncbi:MAG TPA: cytochrome c [Thermoanaerobaculia bacterium]|nr:cytochrome c [Thermoanaerobaculia bacterium]